MTEFEVFKEDGVITVKDGHETFAVFHQEYAYEIFLLGARTLGEISIWNPAGACYEELED